MQIKPYIFTIIVNSCKARQGFVIFTFTFFPCFFKIFLACIAIPASLISLLVILRYRRTLDQCNSTCGILGFRHAIQCGGIQLQSCLILGMQVILPSVFTCGHTLEPPTTDTIGSKIIVLITEVSSFQGEIMKLGLSQVS